MRSQERQETTYFQSGSPRQSWGDMESFVVHSINNKKFYIANLAKYRTKGIPALAVLVVRCSFARRTWKRRSQQWLEWIPMQWRLKWESTSNWKSSLLVSSLDRRSNMRCGVTSHTLILVCRLTKGQPESCSGEAKPLISFRNETISGLLLESQRAVLLFSHGCNIHVRQFAY